MLGNCRVIIIRIIVSYFYNLNPTLNVPSNKKIYNNSFLFCASYLFENDYFIFLNSKVSFFTKYSHILTIRVLKHSPDTSVPKNRIVLPTTLELRY